VDNNILIDFNHLYYLIADKLFKEQFPASLVPFNFQESFEKIDFQFLQEDSSYYFLEHSNPPLHQQVKHFLKQQGYIEENIDPNLDSKMTEKGIVALEKGGIESYKSYREQQERLQIEIQQTTVETNRSVIATNRLQRITTRISVIVSVIALFIACIATYYAYRSHSDSQKLFELEKKSLEMQLKQLPNENNQMVGAVLLKDNDTLLKK
jgi:hypothetical protein